MLRLRCPWGLCHCRTKRWGLEPGWDVTLGTEAAWVDGEKEIEEKEPGLKGRAMGKGHVQGPQKKRVCKRMWINQKDGTRGRPEKPGRKDDFMEKIVSSVDHCEVSGRMRPDIKITGH